MKVLLLVLCAACSLGGKRPNYQYFVLGTHPPAHAADRPYAVSIRQITLPAYLDREEMATRTVENRLVYSSTDRWAEPLDQAIERTLRENLVARGIAVQPHASPGVYELSLEVLRFERTGPDHVDLWARWTLTLDSDVVDRGEAKLRVPTTGPDGRASAAALSEAVSRLASQIAALSRVVMR
jgi:uncharacterized lipoprotein YmbA